MDVSWIVYIMFGVFLNNLETSVAMNSTVHVSNEESIRQLLSTGYNSKIRPNASSELLVNFVLMSLNDLNLELQEMSVMAIIHTIWYDERLKWDPSQYAGITGISLETNEIWTPTLVVQNSVKNIKVLGNLLQMPVRVWYTGKVLWAPLVHLDTSCEMQVLYFPFEEQECDIVLFPYALLSHEIDLKVRYVIDPVEMVYYSENAAWKFVSASSGNVSLLDDGDVYPAITYTLKFKRRWLFLALSLILPAFLNLILMLGVFALHIESGEKIGYSLTVLLSYIVLMSLVGDMLPQVSTQVSLLQIYFASVLIVGCLSTLVTIWIVNIYNRDDDKCPISNTTKMAVKWVVLPLTSKIFWSYFVWRYRKKNNKVVDDKSLQSGKMDTGDSCVDNNESTPIPPMSTYSPCSLKDVHMNKPPKLRRLAEMCRSKYQNIPDLPPRRIATESSICHTDKSCDFPSNVFTTDSEKELTIYSDLSNTPPPRFTPPHGNSDNQFTPPPLTHSNLPTRPSTSLDGYRHEIDDQLDLMKWKDMALLMDSFCLRFLGGVLLSFTLIIMMLLFLQY